jgi:peptidoglycan hydrolase CwlO-like protein
MDKIENFLKVMLNLCKEHKNLQNRVQELDAQVRKLSTQLILLQCSRNNQQPETNENQLFF